MFKVPTSSIKVINGRLKKDFYASLGFEENKRKGFHIFIKPSLYLTAKKLDVLDLDLSEFSLADLKNIPVSTSDVVKSCKKGHLNISDSFVEHVSVTSFESLIFILNDESEDVIKLNETKIVLTGKRQKIVCSVGLHLAAENQDNLYYYKHLFSRKH